MFYDFDDYNYQNDTLTFRDCESMDSLPTKSSVREGIPLVGWLGFTVRNSWLPYKTREEGTGRAVGYMTDEGEYIQEEETETIYDPQFSEIEEIALIVVDGFRQPPWGGIAEKINPKGEGVRLRPRKTSLGV